MSSDRLRWIRIGLFALGLVVSVVMMTRTQIHRDALDLLVRGWLLAARGIWVPLGNPAAPNAGGYVPGSLTSLLLGAPLALWMNHRAPVVPILLAHVGAYLLLDRLLRESFDARTRVVFAIVYWLNPWRLYQSAWLDNSNYVFLIGAVHLWATWRQRQQASVWLSALLALTLILSLQLHLDALVLALASGLLWRRGYWKPSWAGLALGSILGLATLVPFFLEAMRHPEVLPGGATSLEPTGWRVWHAPKGFSYWLRYSSLSFASEMLSFDFTPDLGRAVDRILAAPLDALGKYLGAASLGIPLAANLWLWREHRRVAHSERRDADFARWWLGAYVGWVLTACLVCNLLSPAGIRWWHDLIVVHAAVLPLVLWSTAWPWDRRVVRWGVATYASLSVLFGVAMAFGSMHYRRGGRNFPVRELHDHQMLRDLPLDECCPYLVSPESDSWYREDAYFYREYVAPFRIRARASEPGAGRDRD